MIEVRQGPKQNDLQLGTNTTSEMGSTEEHLPPARNALVRNAEDNKKPEARKQTKETAYCFLRRRSSRNKMSLRWAGRQMVDQMGRPGKSTLNSPLSRYAFGFACSDVALQIGAEMLTLDLQQAGRDGVRSSTRSPAQRRVRHEVACHQPI